MNKAEAFRRTIGLCFRAHPYYREIFGRLRLTPDDLRSPEDLWKLPVTPKEIHMSRPEDFRLRLKGVPGISVEEMTLWEVIYTTGITGRPTPFYDTVHDHYARVAQMRQMAEHAGVGPGDTVANLFPLTILPHQGFLSALYGSLAVGAKMIATFTGKGYPEFISGNSTEKAIRLIERHRATVLWGIASYVRRLVMRAQELGADFSSVRLCFAMGEPCPQGMRGDLRARLATLGAEDVVIQNGYGFTEMQGPTVECRELGGFHVPMADLFHFEIVDPTTQQALTPGTEGLVVISHMHRRGTVLMRYAVGDVCAMDEAPCPHCGESGPRFLRTPYRVKGLAKIKGTMVNPIVLNDVLAQISGIKGYRVVVSKENQQDPYSMDVLRIHVVCAHEVQGRLMSEITRRIAEAIEVTPTVEFVSADALFGDAEEYKFRWFIDERDNASSGSGF